MNEQYFENNPSSISAPRINTVEILGEKMRFVTDNGVFSKGGLDDGTRILLEALPELDGRILDLGCGWGAIGITLAKKYPKAQIVMADVNTRALELAKQSCGLNNVINAQAVESDVYSGIEGTFDYIVTNPPIRAGKQVIYAMFDGAKERLNKGGKLYIVIRKQQGAPSAQKHLEETYDEVRLIAKEKSYWILESGDINAD